MRLVFAVSLSVLAVRAGAESVTMSTTYPSPAGVYKQVVTTGGGGKDTVLAREGDKVVVGKPSASGEKLRVYGDARTEGSSTVTGDAKVQGLVIGGVRFPAPPAGKTTFAWRTLTLTTGTDADTSVPLGGQYSGSPHADSCDGNTTAVYACPAAAQKTCTDSARDGSSGTDSDSNTTYTLCSPGCPDDTCNGDKDGGWSCPSNYSGGCRDIKKMGGVRYKSDWVCNVATPLYRDYAVSCNKSSTQGVTILVAE